MAKTKRIVFSFDERSFSCLDQLRNESGCKSFAEVVRRSLKITRALQSQAKEGFTEIGVCNPNTGEGRVLVLPEPLLTADC